MITMPEDMEYTATAPAGNAGAGPVAKGKVSVSIPSESRAVTAAKSVAGKAGVNVIGKHGIERKHMVMMAGGIAFLCVSFLVSGLVGHSRSSKLSAMDAEIAGYQNQIAMSRSVGTSERQQSNAMATGFSQERFEHDCEVIESSLGSMLNWEPGGMDVVRDAARNLYGLTDANTLLTAFYPASAVGSRFDSVTVYCRKPDEALRSYGCEVVWTVTDADGNRTAKSALLLCSVNDEDRLSAMEVWLEAE